MVPGRGGFPSADCGNVCSILMYSADDFTLVKELQATGLSDDHIAEFTGISRGTVQRWHHREGPPGAAFHRPRAGEWDVGDLPSYCYLLGVYLGDGWTTHRPPNGWTLKVACDERYGQIIAESSRPWGKPSRRPGCIAATCRPLPRR
jgi:hypothetical protein